MYPAEMAQNLSVPDHDARAGSMGTRGSLLFRSMIQAPGVKTEVSVEVVVCLTRSA